MVLLGTFYNLFYIQLFDNSNLDDSFDSLKLLNVVLCKDMGFPNGLAVKNPPAMQEPQETGV